MRLLQIQGPSCYRDAYEERLLPRIRLQTTRLADEAYRDAGGGILEWRAGRLAAVKGLGDMLIDET